MYVDLLDSDNYLLVNVSLIKLLGLAGAAYCSEIFAIVKKAIKKDKLVNKFYIKIDRDYIESRTGVSSAEQKILEDRWQELDLIDRESKDVDNVFNVNIEGFLSLIVGQTYGPDNTENSEKFTKTEIKKLKTKLKPKSVEKERATKKKNIAKAIKKSIVCSDEQVRDKLYEWVDAVINSGRLLTKAVAADFLRTVEQYSAGDSTVMIKVIQKAINSGYSEVEYAITAYEESLKRKKINPSADFRRATGDDLMEGDKF